jgi:hypothetical protein
MRHFARDCPRYRSHLPARSLGSRLDGRLSRCLITTQRRAGAYGYFAGDRFGTRDGHEKTDEIALNPAHLKERTTRETLSTLVHEMTHLEQQ